MYGVVTFNAMAAASRAGLFEAVLAKPVTATELPKEKSLDGDTVFRVLAYWLDISL